MLVEEIFYNQFSGNIHFTASRDLKIYIEKILFLQKALQRALKNDRTFFFHDDNSLYLRRLDEIFQVARTKGLITKHYVNSNGVSYEFAEDGKKGGAKLVRVVEPFAQLLAFVQTNDGICYDASTWEKLRISESARKPDGKKEVKFFNYTSKAYEFQNKPSYGIMGLGKKRSRDLDHSGGKGSGPPGGKRPK